MYFSKKETIEYPILPLKNAVVFPNTVRPLFFNRPQSLRGIQEAMTSRRKVFVVTLKNPEAEPLHRIDIHDIGVIGTITHIQQLPNGAIQARFEAEQRGRLVNSILDDSYFKGEVEPVESKTYDLPELPRMIQSVKKELIKHIEIESGHLVWDDQLNDDNIEAGEFADLIASLLKLNLEQHQEILETLDTRERLEKVYSYLLERIHQREFESEFRARVEKKMGQKQKEYYLNEQMKAIQDELGQNTENSEFEDFAQKIEAAHMPPRVKEIAEKELNKLKMMGQMSHEATPIRNYLDWLTSVPWTKTTVDNLSTAHAKNILDTDHFGLEKVKERIVEYIAVANAVGKLKGPILCLSGPPGVGKTSLAKSIARSLDRKYARISLGGVRDEAEIRGHRRTYIGAMPGKIIQTMKKVGTNNPLILLDEIDKVAQYYTGGPTAALLEVLDPEQNSTFMDHYLEVEYDLSQTLFICTANNLADIPLPLRDRMEIIELSGYTELEKVQIAKKYLIPKQKEENGVQDNQLKVTDNQLLDVIRQYTREAGVRSLERTIAKICRKTVTEFQEKELKHPVSLNQKKMISYLGTPLFQYNQIEETNEIGMVTGLAWTSVGGETLSIEVMTMKGSGKTQLTGKLGDVMKESAQAAISYVRANANLLGIYSNVFKDLDIHIHVPAGGTPKDGPSAGIAITSAIVSALTGIPIYRDVALTGEVTLRGKVLPIGGLKEKLLAAKRSQIKTVLIPEENKKDLTEIPKEIQGDLSIHPVSHVREAFPLLLERLPIAVKDEEVELVAKPSEIPSSSHFEIDGLSPSGNSPHTMEHRVS